LQGPLTEQGLDGGANTIAYHLRQRSGSTPSTRTIHRILLRRGYVSTQPQKRPKSSWIRFESSLPNETWQADVTHWALADKTKIEILDFVDDYSRMVLGAVALPVTTAADVVAAFYKATALWGLPTSILTHNGCIFIAQFKGGRCGFETELAVLGITTKHGKIDNTGVFALRHGTKMHHIGVGSAYRNRRIIALIANIDIRVLSEEGELLRHLHPRPNQVLPAVEDADDGVVGRTDVCNVRGPRRRGAGRGLVGVVAGWSSGWRGCDHSAVTSATAVRADFSSTMALSAAKVATRACTAMLLTARG
jgi:hypothetical protein